MISFKWPREGPQASEDSAHFSLMSHTVANIYFANIFINYLDLILILSELLLYYKTIKKINTFVQILTYKIQKPSSADTNLKISLRNYFIENFYKPFRTLVSDLI